MIDCQSKGRLFEFIKPGATLKSSHPYFVIPTKNVLLLDFDQLQMDLYDSKGLLIQVHSLL